MNDVKTEIKNTQALLAQLRKFFSNYVHGYLRLGDETFANNIIIKFDHTKRVCSEIADLATHCDLGTEETAFAESLALMHDVGRFEQYRRWETYSDANSADHAQLGLSILKEKQLLDGLAPDCRDLFYRCIAYHNMLDIPSNETAQCRFFASLLRDADKLDIWRVVTRYYADTEGPRNSVLELDTHHSTEISAPVAQAVISGHLVQKAAVRTSTDFKVMQMGWVFDLHFHRAYQLVDERRYLEKIVDSMPNNTQVEAIYTSTRVFLDRCLKREKRAIAEI